MRSRWLGFTFAFLAACGSGPATPDGGTPDCPSHANPTFELGTGQAAFEPLVDGQDLSFVPGPQGGCHFWLAVRTDGFQRRGTKLRYEVVYADTGTTTMSFSSFAIALEPTADDPTQCESYGLTGFLIRPWAFVDREVEIQAKVWVQLSPTEEIAATESKRVVARWPGADPNICGPRD